jgi:hypothetical protein
MNTRTTSPQCGHLMLPVLEGGTSISRSQCRHLKYTFAVMKPLMVLLILSVSLQAQSIADAARKERDRRSRTEPARVFVQQGKITDNKSEEAAPPVAPPQNAPQPAVKAKEATTPQVPQQTDPFQSWTDKLNVLRAKFRGLQDQEASLLLQRNDLTNQVYAPVTDPATQERVQAQLAQNREQLAAIRTESIALLKTLDSLTLEGPPKK